MFQSVFFDKRILIAGAIAASMLFARKAFCVWDHLMPHIDYEHVKEELRLEHAENVGFDYRRAHMDGEPQTLALVKELERRLGKIEKHEKNLEVAKKIIEKHEQNIYESYCLDMDINERELFEQSRDCSRGGWG